MRAIRYEDMIANPSSALLMAADHCEISIGYDHAVGIARARSYREFICAELDG